MASFQLNTPTQSASPEPGTWILPVTDLVFWLGEFSSLDI
jgi:hypothetical protein